MTGTILILSILLSIVTDAAYAIIVGTLLAGRWLESTTTSSSRPEAAHFAAVVERPLYFVDEADQPVPRYPSRPLYFSDGADQPQHPSNPLYLITLASAFVLLLTHLARPWFLAASMSGSASLHDNLALIPTILASTHQGTLWYWNSAAIVLLLLSIFNTSRIPAIAIWTSLASLLLIAFAKAATGHAADQGDFTLVEALQAIHILATAVWSGAVLVSGLIVLPELSRLRGHTAVWHYTASLSRSATYALIAVLLSGIYTADRELNNTLAGLWTSAWGKILIVKIAFVLVAVSLGATCRLLHRRADSTQQRSTQIVRLVTSEAVVMIAVICLSGLLGNNAPPMSNM